MQTTQASQRPEPTPIPVDSQTNPHDSFTSQEHSQEKMVVQQPKKMSLASEILFVALICSAQLLTQAGLSLSIVPAQYIAESFGATGPGQTSWYSAAFSLTVGTFILPAGRLGDIFGYKKFFVGGFVWYALWSIVAGLAVYSNQILLDISRAMQGIGPALILPNAIAIVGRTYAGQDRKQEMTFALFGATAPGGFVLGTVFSALLSIRLSWPWAYWILALTCAVLAILGFFVLPTTEADEDLEADSASLWKRLDAIGSVIGVLSLLLINFAFNQGASVGWSAPYIGVTLGLGLLLLALFVYVELSTQYPLVPFRLLKAESLYSLLCISAGWSSFGIFVVYLWNFLDILRQQSILVSSGQFSVVAVTGLVAAVSTGLLISRVRMSLIMLFAMSAFAVGGILFSTMPVEQTYWAQMFVGLVIMPFGMDCSFPAATIVLSRSMSKNYQGTAASLVNTMVNYSISIGLGIAGTVEFYVDQKGATTLEGFRSADYTGLGFAGVGICIALVWCLTERPQKPNAAQDSSAA